MGTRAENGRSFKMTWKVQISRSAPRLRPRSRACILTLTSCRPVIAVYHDLTIRRRGWAPSSLTQVALNFPMSLSDIFTTQDLVRNPRLLLHRSGPAESQFLSYFQYKTLISLAWGPFDGQVRCSVDDSTCVVYSPNMNHVWHPPIGEIEL